MSAYVEFVVAHIAVLTVWGVVVSALAGLGLWFRRLAAPAGLPLRDADLYFTTLTGYAIALLLLQLWHFVWPIREGALAVVLAVGAMGLVVERRAVADWLAANVPRRLSWSVGIAAFLLLWMSNQALGPVSNFDGGAYHIPTMEWANAYRIVPGLGNLHGRLAFNSSSLLFAAALNVGPLDGRAHHLASGVLLVPLMFHSLGALSRVLTPRPTAVAGDAFAATLFITLLFTIIAHEPSSLDTDLPVAIVLLACGERLVRAVYGAGDADSELRSRWHIASLALLSAAALTLKLSAAVMAFAIFVLSCWVYRRAIATSLAALAPAVALAVVLAMSWLARGAILSGYPLYPSSLFPLPVEWRVPAEQTASEADWVTFSARMMLQHDIPIDGNWFPFWLKGLRINPQDAAMLLLPIVVMGFAAAIAWRARNVAETERPHLPRWTLYIAPAIGLVFWFSVAPHPRFAVGSLWIIACTSMGLTVARRYGDDALRAAVLRRWSWGFGLIFAAVLLVQATIAPAKLYERIAWIGRSTALGGLATRPGRDRGMHPMGSSRILRYTTNSGLQLNVPIQNNLCWDAPLCTPHPSPYLRARNPENLGAGFAAESGKWEPVRWPDPLTPFFPYWRCLQQVGDETAEHLRNCALIALRTPTDTLKRVIHAQGGDTVGIAPLNRGFRRASR